jgi:hypothetical protein
MFQENIHRIGRCPSIPLPVQVRDKAQRGGDGPEIRGNVFGITAERMQPLVLVFEAEQKIV